MHVPCFPDTDRRTRSLALWSVELGWSSVVCFTQVLPTSLMLELACVVLPSAVCSATSTRDTDSWCDGGGAVDGLTIHCGGT